MSNAKGRKTKKCVICEELFSPYRSTQKYCSVECVPKGRAKNRPPKKSKGVKKSLVDKKWSLAVRAKAGNRCEYCKATQFLNAHHIISRNNHAVRWDLDNGVSLCVKHHLFSYEFSAHKNPVEFIEWIKEYRGEEWYQNLREKSRCKEKVDKDEVNKYLTELLKEMT